VVVENLLHMRVPMAMHESMKAEMISVNKKAQIKNGAQDFRNFEVATGYENFPEKMTKAQRRR
jgi:hypothetical protein